MTGKVIRQIMKFFFHKMPLESVLSGLAYLLENFHPTIITILSAHFFEKAYDYLAGTGEASALWRYAAGMTGYYIAYHVLYSLSSICINAGIYEKAMHLLNDELVETLSGLPLIQYEEEEMLSRRKRAEECVKNDRIPGIFMLTIVLITSVAGILSLLVTLGTYHPLLSVVAVASVAQFFLSDWLLEREGYRLETALTQKKRMRDYIWGLFTDFGSVREMRVMGFGGHLAERWKRERDAVNEEEWKLDRKKCRYHLLCDCVKTFGYLTGVVFAVLLLRKGVLSVGAFGACLVAFASVQTAVANFFGSVGKIPGFTGLAADYFAMVSPGTSPDGCKADVRRLSRDSPATPLKAKVIAECTAGRDEQGREKQGQEKHRQEKRCREELSQEKRCREGLSQEKRCRERLSPEKRYWEELSQEELSQEKQGQEELSQEAQGQEKRSQEELSQEELSRERRGREKQSQEKKGRKKQSHEKQSREFQGEIDIIEIKNVSFQYPHSETPALKSVSLTIRKGEVISLVGVNGSGKTTLVKLLLGIYSPESGTVCYNGKNLEYLDKSSLYSHAALLSQDFALYPLSLEENIALADIARAGERERIRETLERVHMEGLLQENGSGKIMGREFGGPEFSGGQKQRLALARVLFADRELIILDEPTSALDPLQENEILEEFLRLAKGRTTIIISHRVGLCRYVDRIAVMGEGSLTECGSHEELMAAGGEYAKLYHAQSRWYL